MNFLDKIEKSKALNKDIEKITSVKIFTEAIKDDKKGLYLEINTMFKIIIIDFIGYVKLTNHRYNGFLITKSMNSIIITNLRKKTLNNNLLFEFVGNISDFKRVRVFGWGQNATFAEKTMTSDTSVLFENNDNVVSSDDTKFPILEDEE